VGERKRNAIDTNVSMTFLSFSLVFMLYHVTVMIKSSEFFRIILSFFIYKTTKKMILNESDDNEQFTKFELKNVLNKFLNML